MAKRTDLKKILIIGSGPIVIGQAAEFDYAGTQACLALKEEGYEVVLVNSNPATIMTDTVIADKVYMEPLTLEYVAKILRYERPDAIVPGIGGQTGLNLAMQLEKKGVLKECHTELLGTSSESIERAEDREMFKELCQSIGEPVIPSEITYNLEEAKAAAERIGYPVVLRPAFTLGGTGGGFANNEKELLEIGINAFKLSPVHQVLIEKSVKGYKEIEFEVMRDGEDNAITIGTSREDTNAKMSILCLPQQLTASTELEIRYQVNEKYSSSSPDRWVDHTETFQLYNYNPMNYQPGHRVIYTVTVDSGVNLEGTVTAWKDVDYIEGTVLPSIPSGDDNNDNNENVEE